MNKPSFIDGGEIKFGEKIKMGIENFFSGDWESLYLLKIDRFFNKNRDAFIEIFFNYFLEAVEGEENQIQQPEEKVEKLKLN